MVFRQAPRRRAGLHALETTFLVFVLLVALFAIFIATGDTGPDEATRRKRTEERLVAIVRGLEDYRRDVGHYPDRDDGALLALVREPSPTKPDLLARWRGPYLPAGLSFEDGWGRPIEFEIASDGAFRLRSVGPDGERGTEDDVEPPPDPNDLPGT